MNNIYIYIWYICLSAEGAKNVSWPWLSPLRGWGSLTMAFTGKFVYIYIYIYIYINKTTRTTRKTRQSKCPALPNINKTQNNAKYF